LRAPETGLFGRPLTVTLANRPDAMAVAAVGIVGEGAIQPDRMTF
jgi:hypothetical protein